MAVAWLESMRTLHGSYHASRIHVVERSRLQPHLQTKGKYEDAMDKEVAVKVKDHKRKHDSDDEEEAVAREVHATHARIVSGPDPEPMQEDQTRSNSGKLHVSLAGPNPEHMDDEFLVTAYPKVHENLKLITDERGRI
ncbi:hypothetical protein Tco_0998604 [Tanacetum coccineum]